MKNPFLKIVFFTLGYETKQGCIFWEAEKIFVQKHASGFVWPVGSL